MFLLYHSIYPGFLPIFLLFGSLNSQLWSEVKKVMKVILKKESDIVIRWNKCDGAPSSCSHFSSHFFPPCGVAYLWLTRSLCHFESDAGERTDCTHRHSNTVLMMATSVTWRFHVRAAGRGLECEGTAQLTPQCCPLICFPLTSPSTYSSVSVLLLFSDSQ